ncbi:hypothetical protein B7463_g10620, partial [Scytalidium lignicola]
MGPFCNAAKAAVLLGEVQDLIAKSTCSPYVDIIRYNSFDVSLQELGLKLMDLGTRWWEMCCSNIGICFAALLSLHMIARELSSMNNTVDGDECAAKSTLAIKSAITMILDIGRNFNMDIPFNNIPSLPPAASSTTYLAALLHIQFAGERFMTDEWHLEMLAMKKTIETFAQRWSSGKIFLDHIETAISHEMQARAGLNTMSTLVVIGSGPGIGASTASLFAARKFSKIALISRNLTRLSEDRDKVIASARSAGRNVDVKAWSVDITDSETYIKVLKEVEKFGDVSCVHFNAARVDLSTLLEFDENEMLYDFKTTNIALYTTAIWAIPILEKLPRSDNPSILVASSFLWQDPIPELFSLSMVKAAQRNMVQSLQKVYPNIHTAIINIGGPVSKEDPYLNPDAIAKKIWELYSQSSDSWTPEINVLAM